jgi:hypothetical protein
MTNKSFKHEDSQHLDYHNKAEAGKKSEKPNTESIVNSLRSDMLPASSVLPAKKNIFQQVNLKIIVAILISFVILGWIWFSLAGPGRPILERSLANLVHLRPTSTLQVVSLSLPATNTPPKPSKTPLPSSTAHPTLTPTKKIVASPTHKSPTITPTSTPACRDVSTITLADVGQTLCVQGKLIEIVDKPNSFMLVFSNKPGAFYWVSYDIVWSQAKVDTCYQIRGKINQIANSPILVFDYSNIPEVCP